ncbi:hypothetical protein KEG38_23235 [Polyangium jinanense]|nr:hypothetical protein [Polyangium jinanense]
MSEVAFHAWCEESAKVDAFIAAVLALMGADAYCRPEPPTPGRPRWTGWDDVPVAEVVEILREKFTRKSAALLWGTGRGASGEQFWLRMQCHGVDYNVGRWKPEVLLGGDWQDFPSPEEMRCFEFVLPDGERSPAAEAAYVAMYHQRMCEHALLCVCSPDESKRVTTGGISSGRWYAPLEIAGTYHLDGNVARDLVLSWMYIHEGERIEYIAGLPMDALAARIEATPKGTRIGIATNAKHRGEHIVLDMEATNTKLGWPLHPGAVRRGARKRLPTDVELSREEVLAALQLPPVVLLEALEASAVPDQDWRDAEAIARAMTEAKEKGGATSEIYWPDGTHVQFLKHHAPYHVRRLPNGGVLLATHPYRTLWQLWADALNLLGIRR